MTTVAPPAPSEEQSFVSRGGWMILGRITDQAALGFLGIILAARLSLIDYAPIAALLVIQSMAATLSDLGLAHEVLRLEPGQQASQTYSRWLTRINLGIAGAGVLALVAAETIGATGVLRLVGFGMLLWSLSSEWMMRHSASMLAQEHWKIGLSQTVGAVLIVLVTVFWVENVVHLGIALMARVVLEILMLRSARSLFSASPNARKDLAPLPVVATHGLGFASRNVDYLLGAPFLGRAGFSTYVFSFRISNAAFAPVGSILTRLGITELSSDMANRYRRGVIGLFTAGFLAIGVTAVAAFVLPSVIGDNWGRVTGIILILSIGLPWRFIEGLVAPVLYVSDRHSEALKLEGFRLGLVAIAVLIGSQWGTIGLATGATAATVFASWASHRWATRIGNLKPVAMLDAALGLTLLALPIVVLLVR